MATFWFIAITVLWTGFLVLEGFDFGVGALHTAVGGDDAGRGEVMHTIAPVWDGNEVWLVVAVAGTFAAFPGWYATGISALYPVVVVLLVVLILRGVGIEFRGKRQTARWRQGWSITLVATSLLAPLLVGIVLADFLYGLPINGQQEFVGDFGDLFSAYSVVTGLAFVAICLLHGAIFLCLKTDGEQRVRARRIARSIAPVTAALVFAMVIWTHVTAGHGLLINIVELAALVAVVAAVWLVIVTSWGWAFIATVVTIAGMVVSIFTDLYPNVLVSTLDPANNLTVHSTASGSYSLTVMTVVVAIFLPGVLVYQAWTYHVFRRRITAPSIGRTSANQP
jgi:cytochrome d ubiquinol oxidase subunit II